MRRILLILFLSLIATSPAAAQPQAAAGQGAAYRINPGDELDVLVWGDERLQRQVRVLPDGTFAFPLVGQVVAAGRLPAEIERVITAGLQPQYRGQVPQVTVSVRNPTGFQFSVIGKVKGPGTFTPGRYVTALEALSIAGGPTEFADINNIRIIRRTGNDTQLLRLRLSGILRGDNVRLSPNDNPLIQSGDTLVVP